MVLSCRRMNGCRPEDKTGVGKEPRVPHCGSVVSSPVN